MVNDIAIDQRRILWRRAVQLRSTTISRVVRHIEAALGASFAKRQRQRGRWIFFATFDGVTVPAVVVVLSPSRTLEQLAVPPSIRLLAPAMLNTETIDRIGRVAQTVERTHGE
ncbi:MAG TPA: hypothetical protein VK550_00710 [Polyangiaceae bacterium]|nr:hypothetical protein [Polyangiaceae bacterium]